MSSSNTSITASYAPQAGSFAVVPSSNRSIVNSTTSGLVTSTVVQQSGSQPIPVRFNPQLIVDGNKESASYDGLLQKQLGGHQQVQHFFFLLIPAMNTGKVTFESNEMKLSIFTKLIFTNTNVINLFQISYISMPQTQTLTNQQKTAHIIPASIAKPSSVVVAAASSPRATTIVSTAPRKREHGKTLAHTFNFLLEIIIK